MARLSRTSLSLSAIAAYLCICVALILLLMLTVWGAYRDLRSLRTALLQAEVNRLRTHAVRTVGRLERDSEIAGASGLDSLPDSVWLVPHWERFVQDDAQMYAAIVGSDNRIRYHSDAARSGRRLPNEWYEEMLRELGEGVVRTKSPELGIGKEAFDVHVPIVVDGRTLGEYHVGLSVEALQDRLGQHEREFLQRRALVVGGVLLIVLLAATSLYYIASYAISLRKTIDRTSVKQATEVSALVAGLAHEIRNPLHAIQLNLHTLQRSQERGQPLAANEMKKLLGESISEIDRIEHLMQQLVGFATPEQPRDEIIDLTAELRDVVDFIEQELLRSNIELHTDFPQTKVKVRMDHGRLRQVMLNLLQNAQQAMPQGGQLRIALRRMKDRAEITVADNGPGISAEDRDRLFEPFFSTKDGGTGLGLALVKRFVEEAGGKVICKPGAGGGTTFQIVLPLSGETRMRG